MQLLALTGRTGPFVTARARSGWHEDGKDARVPDTNLVQVGIS